MTQKWKGLCRTVAVPWEYTWGCKPMYWIWFAHMSKFGLAKVVLCLHCTITTPMICILPMDTPPSDSKTPISHYNLTFTGLKIQKLPEWACIVHFSGYIQVIFIQTMGCQLLTVSVQAHMMLPFSIFDHVNNDQIWELVEAPGMGIEWKTILLMALSMAAMLKSSYLGGSWHGLNLRWTCCANAFRTTAGPPATILVCPKHA